MITILAGGLNTGNKSVSESEYWRGSRSVSRSWSRPRSLSRSGPSAGSQSRSQSWSGFKYYNYSKSKGSL